MPLFGTLVLSYFPYSLDDVTLLYILFIVPFISIYALSRMPRRLLQCAACECHTQRVAPHAVGRTSRRV